MVLTLAQRPHRAESKTEACTGALLTFVQRVAVSCLFGATATKSGHEALKG